MQDYHDLTDEEKFVDYPEEFIEELRKEFHSGNTAEAIARAEEQGIDLMEIIN